MVTILTIHSTYKVLEEGANTFIERRNYSSGCPSLKFIQNLRAALVRIETKLTVSVAKQVN